MSKGRYFDRSRSQREREKRQCRRELINANSGMFEDELIDENELENEQTEAFREAWVPDDKRKWYVVDTNLILSCVDVIYDADDENWRPPRNFRPSLDNAHLIIPEKVKEELNHMKDGHTVNKSIAKKALRRIAKITENSERTMQEIMNLKAPIRTGWKNQTISVMPLHRNFSNSLPWIPNEKDNDGWIAVTALAATMLRDGLPVNGTVPMDEILERDNHRKNVILLTNDNDLHEKADRFAVRVKSYSFEPQPVFTGLRELVVPAEMFAQFDSEGRLSREDFEKYMPNEAPLVANEYIAMVPEDDLYPRGYLAAAKPYANVARYHRDSGMLYPMRFMKKEKAIAPNIGIATYFDAMNDYSVSVIVVTGKAGTGKTFQIIRHAIEAVRKGVYSRIILIVNPDNGVGYLPGSQEKKLEPMIAFCKDAIRAYLAETSEFKRRRELLRKHGDVDEDLMKSYEITRAQNKCRILIEELSDESYDEADDEWFDKKRKKPKKTACNNTTDSGANRKSYAKLLDEQVDYIYKQYFTAIPYKQAQGRTFEDAIIIVDEAQRIIIDEMETFITRLGKNSLLAVCGDVNQIKYNSPEKRIKNGLIFTRKIYYNWEGCVNIHLTDNMRHEAADIANRNYEKVIEEIGELET